MRFFTLLLAALFLVFLINCKKAPERYAYQLEKESFTLRKGLPDNPCKVDGYLMNSFQKEVQNNWPIRQYFFTTFFSEPINPFEIFNHYDFVSTTQTATSVFPGNVVFNQQQLSSVAQRFHEASNSSHYFPVKYEWQISGTRLFEGFEIHSDSAMAKMTDFFEPNATLSKQGVNLDLGAHVEAFDSLIVLLKPTAQNNLLIRKISVNGSVTITPEELFYFKAGTTASLRILAIRYEHALHGKKVYLLEHISILKKTLTVSS